MQSPSVICVIVTWNRKKLLERCIDSIRAQTIQPAEVLIVDNASSDGTIEYLNRDPKLTTIQKTSNTGGAGGFQTALEYAVTTSHEYVWLMDDDAWANPDALEQLLKWYSMVQPAPTFVSSRVVDLEGETVNAPTPDIELHAATSWDRLLHQGLLPLKASSFVSLLIPLAQVRNVGTPLGHYFLWLDDFEYTLRLSSIGTGWYVPHSIVNHERPGGLRVPDLILEPVIGRIHLYQHFYSNLLETQARHSKRFSWWKTRYTIMALRTLARLIAMRDFKKATTLIQGVLRGIRRAILLNDQDLFSSSSQPRAIPKKPNT